MVRVGAKELSHRGTAAIATVDLIIEQCCRLDELPDRNRCPRSSSGGVGMY